MLVVLRVKEIPRFYGGFLLGPCDAVGSNRIRPASPRYSIKYNEPSSIFTQRDISRANAIRPYKFLIFGSIFAIKIPFYFKQLT